MNTGHKGSHPKCYLRDLQTCSEKISGEHAISATVLKAINKDAITIAGFPWLKKGETRSVGIKSLVANCLCEAHNSALSSLDAGAGQFYRALQSAVRNNDNSDIRQFSGHDIERWLLKTTAGLAASRNLSAESGRLPGVFTDEISVPELLQNPSAWKAPIGLYSIQSLGQSIQLKDEFGLAPLASEGKEIGGLITQIHGFTLLLLAVPSTVIKGSLLEGKIYRITTFTFRFGPQKRTIDLCWDHRS
jgi:hypothetical protein